MIRKRKHIESHWMQLNISLNEQMNNHKQAHKCTLCIVIYLFTKYILKKKNSTETIQEPKRKVWKVECTQNP